MKKHRGALGVGAPARSPFLGPTQSDDIAAFIVCLLSLTCLLIVFALLLFPPLFALSLPGLAGKTLASSVFGGALISAALSAISLVLWGLAGISVKQAGSDLAAVAPQKAPPGGGCEERSGLAVATLAMSLIILPVDAMLMILALL